MPLHVLFQKWWVRAHRRRLIRQELKAFAKISPELYSDIGLFPQSFSDQAERMVDCRLRHCSGQIEGRTEYLPSDMQSCPSGAA